MGLPELIASCVHLQEPGEGEGEVNARQEGPADAQVDGREADDGTRAKRHTLQEGEQEEGECFAGVADADMQLDADRQLLHAEVLLRRQALRAQQTLEHEQRVRAAAPETMAGYKSNGARRELERGARAIKAALSGARVHKMRAELQKAQERLEPDVPPPSGRASADWMKLACGRQVLVVLTAQEAMSSFDPALWSSMDPKSFHYGDGVFGIARRVRLSFREWVSYLADRDELVYDGGREWHRDVGAEEIPGPRSERDSKTSGGGVEAVAEVEPQAQAASRADNFAERLPRWRSARDLQTVQYCLWRRRAYIHSGRLMANRKAWERALEDAGQLTSKEMWETTALLGKNAGFK